MENTSQGGIRPLRTPAEQGLYTAYLSPAFRQVHAAGREGNLATESRTERTNANAPSMRRRSAVGRVAILPTATAAATDPSTQVVGLSVVPAPRRRSPLRHGQGDSPPDSRGRRPPLRGACNAEPAVRPSVEEPLDSAGDHPRSFSLGIKHEDATRPRIAWAETSAGKGRETRIARLGEIIVYFCTLCQVVSAQLLAGKTLEGSLDCLQSGSA
jgi:hypothetical protein